jgi:3-oxoacyl-[acyl-carrier protein] reductase
MLKNTKVLVTGSNGDIGRKIIKSLVKNEAEVICHIRKKDKNFLKFISSLKKKNIKIFYADINDEKAFKKEIDSIFSKSKKLDVLINNAAEPFGSLLEMTPINKLKDVFETNFFSQIRVTQNLLRYLKKSKNGNIINIGSVLGQLSERGTIAYGTSKAAFMYATKIMANEFSNYNIRVNGVCPNVTITKMANKMDPNIKNFLINKSYLKRPCKTSDVANLILFLSSKESSYINGEIINLNGGM